MADLLTAQRQDEEQHAADGYYVVDSAWRPLPTMHRLMLRLRHGPAVELGGTIVRSYLYRPDVTWRDGRGTTGPRRSVSAVVRGDGVGVPSVPDEHTVGPAVSVPGTRSKATSRRPIGRPRVSGAS